jgi:hypothetical protein
MLGCDGGGGGVRTGRKIREIACAGEEERVVFKLYTSGRYLRGMCSVPIRNIVSILQ